MTAISPMPQVAEDVRPAYLIGALSAGAAVIHLMMAPAHAAASQAEALGFAAAGWFQMITAMLLLFRPSRRLLAVTGIGNAAILAAWVWSRTKGLPIGADPWQPEVVGGVDLTSALFEAGIVVGVLAHMLPRPAFRVPAVVAVIGAIAVLGVTTAVLVNPQTADHHGGTPEAGAAAPAQLASAPARCDESMNPVSFWKEARIAGTDGAVPASTATSDAGSAAPGHHGGSAAGTPSTVAGQPATTTTLGPLNGRGSPGYDKIVKLANQPGEAAAGFLIAELAKASDAEYQEFITSLNPANASAAGHDMSSTATGNNSSAASQTMSHLGPQQWKPMSNPADCDRVRKELEQTKAVATKYPTAADAMAGGYVRVAPYVPGIASHWMKFPSVDDRFDVNDPEMLLFDGNGKEAHIVGVSYYLVFDSNTPPSQGFTGDNDMYHRHLGLCTSRTGGVIGDSATTDAECEAAGGKKSNGGSGWMSHAWVVPGCESPWGVFSGINPLLDQKLGAESGKDAGGCAASAVRSRYDLSPASKATMPTTTLPAQVDQAAGK